MQTNPIPPRQPRRSRRRHRGLLWGLLIIAFIAAAAMGALFASNSLLDKSSDDVVEDGLLTAKDKTTIMIMGVDERDDDVGRSDTLMVATLDPKKDHAALMSIPRDTRVKIKGHGWDKINAAYAYGSAKGGPEAGEKLTQRTVKDFLGVNMDHYVVINIQAFQKIIDAIGGIYLDITPEEVEKGYITGYITEIEEATGIWQPQLAQAGYQLCNGVYAVAYCRNRYTTGMDMGRTSRQREVIDKMLQQAKVASPSALLTAVRYACPNINTTLSNDELFALAADVNSYSIIDTEGFPYTYDLTLGTLGVFGVKDSLVCTDLAGDVKKLHTYLFGDDGYEPSQTVKDISYTIQKAFGVGQ